MTAFDGLLPKPVRLTATDTTLPPEGYRLTITRDSVHVDAADDAGAFYAEQTLRQLRGPDAFRAASIHNGPWRLPSGIVEDYPRFAWRGCLLDVARHFMPKAAVLRFIDLLAAHKLNVLHLHLTDDQGWRIEVPEFPRLTEVGAWRVGSWVGRPPDTTVEHDQRPHGGYYTTADLREIVAYAAARHVTVVPEVDIPGHSQAAVAAYPSLGTGEARQVLTRWGISDAVLNEKESTIDFYRRVFEHVLDVFPSPVIHLGGDEADGGRRLVTEIAAHLTRLGRRPMGWDEILRIADLPADVIIACWRDGSGPMDGRDTVLCPERYLYLDHRQSDHPDEPIPVGYVTTLADVYGYQPPDGALGAQAQVWTEHLDNPRRVDYAAFPRLAAFAEIAWSPPEGRDYPEFEARLAKYHLPRLDALGVEYRPLAGPHPWQTRPGVPGRPRYRGHP